MKKIYFLGIPLFALILAGCFHVKETVSLNTEKSEKDKTSKTQEIIVDALYPQHYDKEYAMGTFFTPLGSSVEINEKARAELNKNNEEIIGDGTLIVAFDENSILFSTSNMQESNAGGGTVTNKIYAYNIQTGNLRELFKKTSQDLFEWVIRGNEGTKLIIEQWPIDNSPGPCSSWLDSRYLMFLDVTSVASGLKLYQVPQYKIAEEQQKQAVCINALNAEWNMNS